MFSSIIIRKQNLSSTTDPLDIGYLLECMLFYRIVTVVCNSAALRQLLSVFGWEQLLALLETQTLAILYTENLFGVHTSTRQNREFHSFILMRSDRLSLQNQLPETLNALIGKRGKARKIALRLGKLIEPTQIGAQSTSGMESILFNHVYLEEAIRAILRHLVPEFPKHEQISIYTERTDSGFIFESSLNYELLNKIYHTRISPKESSINPAYLLALICEVDIHAYFAARQHSELAVDPIGSDLIASRIEDLSKRSSRSDKSRKEFSELVLEDAKTLRETFNRGEIPIPDVVKVILNANRFKEWLEKQAEDSSLIREYYNEITRGTFIDKLPGKSTRWATFTGIGLISETFLPTGLGTAAGIALSAVDCFFIEQLIKGWKPNHFIEEQLEPILK